MSNADGPALGDAVVVDGQKYRVRGWWPDGRRRLVQHFGGAELTLQAGQVEQLVYDKRVGVWRLQGAASEGARSDADP